MANLSPSPKPYSPPSTLILSSLRQACGSDTNYVNFIWAARDFEQVRRPLTTKDNQ